MRQIQQANVTDRLLTVDDLGSPLLSGMYASFLKTEGHSRAVFRFSVDGENYFGRAERVGEGFDNLFISLAIPYDTMLQPAAVDRHRSCLWSVARRSYSPC